MQAQPLFHTEKLEKSVFLVFEKWSYITICSQNSFLYNDCKELSSWRSEFSAVSASVSCSSVKRAFSPQAFLWDSILKKELLRILKTGLDLDFSSPVFNMQYHCLAYKKYGFQTGILVQWLAELVTWPVQSGAVLTGLPVQKSVLLALVFWRRNGWHSSFIISFTVVWEE